MGQRDGKGENVGGCQRSSEENCAWEGNGGAGVGRTRISEGANEALRKAGFRYRNKKDNKFQFTSNIIKYQ